MVQLVDLKWKRPSVVEYPKVWRTFSVKSEQTDKSVEYRIQDLPESRFNDAIEFMAQIFCRIEPLCKAYEVFNDPDAIMDLKLSWRMKMEQKMALICFREGSNEIVGLNLTYVRCKDDANLMQNYVRLGGTPKIRNIYKLLLLLSGNCNLFEKYGVEQVFTSNGLVVGEKFRGQGIGGQLLSTRRDICKAFQIKVTSSFFVSICSNRIADKVGFKLENRIKLKDVRCHFPHLYVPHIDSDEITIKSMTFDIQSTLFRQNQLKDQWKHNIHNAIRSL